MGRMIRKFLGHVLPGVMRPLRILWNEVIGFLFMVLAGLGALYTIRFARHFDGALDSFGKLIVCCLFAGIMGYFGITSFLRARKISRS